MAWGPHSRGTTDLQECCYGFFRKTGPPGSAERDPHKDVTVEALSREHQLSQLDVICS